MNDQAYDNGWNEDNTVMRPIQEPSYQDILDLPDGAEVMFFAEDQYNAGQMCAEMREHMLDRLRVAGPGYENPSEVGAAELVIWIHPDDMSDQKRAAISEYIERMRASA